MLDNERCFDFKNTICSLPSSKIFLEGTRIYLNAVCAHIRSSCGLSVGFPGGANFGNGHNRQGDDDDDTLPYYSRAAVNYV